jgi:lysophospholipase L1-like esterase
MSGFNVVNAGISGEVSAQGLARLPGVINEVRPALLILCHGGNDLLRKLPETSAEQNLRDMIAIAQSHNIPVVLLGVPKPAIFLSTADWYDEIADSTGVVYISDVIAEVLGDADLRADAAHPNAQGYRQMAEVVYAALREAGAL